MEHSGWGHSAIDESQRLQLVREEILEDTATIDEAGGVTPTRGIATPQGTSLGHSNRRRTQSIDYSKEYETDREIQRRRDEYLESIGPGESRPKIHLLGLGVRLAGLLGVKNKLIRKTAFFPPTPPSYGFIPLPHDAANVLVSPQNCSFKILAEECYLFLKMNKHNHMSDQDIPQNVLTPNTVSHRRVLTGSESRNPGMLDEEKRPKSAPRVTDGGGSILQTLPASKLRVAAFRLRRVADGDFMTAAVLVYKPILKSEAVCREDPEDMLTDLQLRPLILFSHGNSTDIGYDLFSLAQLASRLHVNVLSYDYPEYGLSRGKLTEKTLFKSFKVAYDFVRQRLKVPRTMIFLYGQSVGSVPTSYAAGNPQIFPCCGVILHSPLASGLRILVAKDTVSRSDIFDNNARLGSCPWPLLIVHGCKDTEIPVWHGCRLDKTVRDYKVASEEAKELFKELVIPHLLTQLSDIGLSRRSVEDLWCDRVKIWLPEFAGHNNIEILYKAEYFRRLRTFIAEHAGRIAFSKK